MSKQFWGVIVIIILVFVGIFALSANKTSAPGKAPDATKLTQHLQGQGKAGVTLIEYGDYQCPYCGQYYPILKQVQSEFDQQIHFQFRNFPLVGLHPNAFAAARTAEAATLQDKFWEMHDLLYENQNQWAKATDPASYFKQYAAQLGLNTAQFEKDFASSKVNDLINADVAEGTKLKVEGTPAFFLDGKLLDGKKVQTVAAFEQVIKAEIAKKAPSTSSKASGAAQTTQTTPATTGQ